MEGGYDKNVLALIFCYMNKFMYSREVIIKWFLKKVRNNPLRLSTQEYSAKQSSILDIGWNSIFHTTLLGLSIMLIRLVCLFPSLVEWDQRSSGQWIGFCFFSRKKKSGPIWTGTIIGYFTIAKNHKNSGLFVLLK